MAGAGALSVWGCLPGRPTSRQGKMERHRMGRAQCFILNGATICSLQRPEGHTWFGPCRGLEASGLSGLISRPKSVFGWGRVGSAFDKHGCQGGLRQRATPSMSTWKAAPPIPPAVTHTAPLWCRPLSAWTGRASPALPHGRAHGGKSRLFSSGSASHLAS